MKRILPILLLAVLHLAGYSQGPFFPDPQYTYRYKITVREALEFDKKPWKFDALKFLKTHTLTDSVNTPKELPSLGYYLCFQARGFQLFTSLEHRSNLTPVFEFENNPAVVRVFNTSGEPVSGFEVSAGASDKAADREIPIRKSWKNKHLVFSYNGDTLLIERSDEQYYYDYNRTFHVKPRKYKYTIVSDGEGGWKSLRSSAKWTIGGMISQPQYRPEDTIQGVVHPFQSNGKRYTQPLIMHLTQYWWNDVQYADTLYPDQKGIYAFSLPVDPEWPIDKTYSVYFKTLKGNYFDNNLSFELKDYALDEVTFHFTPNLTEVLPGDKLEWDVFAEATSGAGFSDIVFEGIVKVKDIVFLDQDFWQFNDTLYSVRQILPRNEHFIWEIPDSILPRIQGDLEFTGKIILTGGEIQEKTETIEIKRTRKHVRAEDKGTYYRFQTSGSELQEISLHYSWGTRTITSADSIPADPELQYAQAADSALFMSRYGYYSYEYIAGIPGNPQVNIDFIWKNDTLAIQLSNIRKIPVRLQYGKNTYMCYSDTVIYETEESTLAVHYLWGGKYNEYFEYPAAEKKDLVWTWNLPEKIQPGAWVDVSGTVRKTDGSAWDGVQVSLAGINNLFNKETSHVLPNFPVGKETALYYPDGFTFTPSQSFDYNSISQAFQQHLSVLNQTPYAEAFGDSVAQTVFIPDSLNRTSYFIIPVQNGRPQILRYIIRGSSLDYMQNEENHTIPAEAGTYNFKLRTMDQSHTIPKITLQSGGKNVVFVNLNHPAVKSEKATYRMMEYDAYLYNQYRVDVYLRYNTYAKIPVAFESGGRIFPIETFYSYAPNSIGPSNVYYPITLWFADGSSQKWTPRPNYKYYVDEEQILGEPVKEYTKGSYFPSYSFEVITESLCKHPVRLRDLMAAEKPVDAITGFISGAQTNELKIFSDFTKQDTYQIYIRPVNEKFYYYLEKNGRAYYSTTEQNIRLTEGIYTLYVYNASQKQGYTRALEIQKDMHTCILLDSKNGSPYTSAGNFRTQNKLKLNDWMPVSSRGNLSVELEYYDIQTGNPIQNGNVHSYFARDYYSNNRAHSGNSIQTLSHVPYHFLASAPGYQPALIKNFYVLTSDLKIRIGLEPDARYCYDTLPDHAPNFITNCLPGWNCAPQGEVLQRSNNFSKPVSLRDYLASTVSDNGEVIYIDGVKIILDETLQNVPGIGKMADIASYGISTSSNELQEVTVSLARKKFRTANSPSFGGEASYAYGWSYNDDREESGAYSYDRITYGSIDNKLDFSGLLSQQGGFEFDEMNGGIRSSFSDLAFWEPVVPVSGDGSFTARVKFPDNITRWDVYALFSDENRHFGLKKAFIQAYKERIARLMLPRFMVEGDEATATGTIESYIDSTWNARISWKSNNVELAASTQSVSQNASSSQRIQATGPDTLAVSFSFTDQDYSDGEEREIPVIQPGVTEYEGHFYYPERTGSFTYALPDTGTWYVYASADPLILLKSQLEKLQSYPFECNEQLASKLVANLGMLKLDINRKERIFAEKEIRRIIKLLEKNYDEGLNGWSWWGKTGRINPAITHHIASVLKFAYQQGADLPYSLQNFTYTFELEADYVQLFNSSPREGSSIRIDSLKKVYDKLVVWKYRQYSGRQVPVDSILDLGTESRLNGLYWGDSTLSWWNSRVKSTCLAYDIIYQADSTHPALKRIRTALFNELSGSWQHNTAEASYLIMTLMKNGSAKKFENVKTLINGEVCTGEKMTVSGNSPLRIETNSEDVCLSFFRSKYNPNPQPVSNQGFKISTRWKNEKGEFLSGNQLPKDQQLQLIVEVDVSEPVSYASLEIPIPAGCYYGEYTSSYGEAHREHFKEKTMIFAEYLSPGKYTYTIELESRFEGKYYQRPATIARMYYPYIFGRNAGTKLTIGK